MIDIRKILGWVSSHRGWLPVTWPAAALVLAGLTGCSQEDVAFGDGGAENALSITASIAGSSPTRASSYRNSSPSYWYPGSHIGVFAFTGDTPAADGAVTKASNVEYVNTVDWEQSSGFSAVGAPVYLKESAAWNMFAYYPYHALDADNTFAVKCDEDMWRVTNMNYSDVTGDLDILTTQSTDGSWPTASNKSTSVGLTFRHAMSRVTVNVVPDEPGLMSIQDVLTEMCGYQYPNMDRADGYGFEVGPLVWQGKYNPVQNEFTLDEESRKVVDLAEQAESMAEQTPNGTGGINVDYGTFIGSLPKEDGSRYMAVEPFYVIPQTLTSALTFRLTTQGESYICSVSAPFTFEAGKSYNFTLKYSSKKELTVSGCTISSFGEAESHEIETVTDDYAHTQVGDIMYEDGFTSPTAVSDHGSAVGIVAALYDDSWVTLKDGVKNALMNKGVRPHGLVLSLKHWSGAWSSNSGNVVGTRYGTPSAAYGVEVDGMSFLMQRWGAGTMLDQGNNANTDFKALYWCRNLNTTANYDHTLWMDDNTTGWYMPSYTEWVDMSVSWMKATPGFDNCEELISWLKGENDGASDENIFSFGVHNSAVLDKSGETLSMVNGWISSAGSTDIISGRYLTTTEQSDWTDRVILIGFGRNDDDAVVMQTEHTYKHYGFLSVRAVFAF